MNLKTKGTVVHSETYSDCSQSLFLERQLTTQDCHCSRGIWTMPLTRCFIFWSALKQSGSWTR